MKKYLALLLACVAFSSYAQEDLKNTQVEKIGSTIDTATENVAPAFHNIQKDGEVIALNYVNQPPMVPHSIKGYQVTKNTNQCLACHGVEHYRTTGAPRISPTHFMDRDGKISANVAPRRYFCLQCHVPQTDASPIIENKFQPTKGFGG